jgi:predicted glutamine amidotransferase
MCRWLIYKGDRITLADVITRPKNSLIHQAFDAKHLPGLENSELYCAAQSALRNSLINADGFGIAW